VDEIEDSSFSSTIAAGRRIGLTMTDAVYTVCVSGGFSAHYQEHKTVNTTSGIVKPILLPAAIGVELRSISSTIAAVLV
jgi:hypothetical protein